MRRSYAAPASTRRRWMSLGPSGVLRTLMPRWARASPTALATAAWAPMGPPSPMPGGHVVRHGVRWVAAVVKGAGFGGRPLADPVAASVVGAGGRRLGVGGGNSEAFVAPDGRAPAPGAPRVEGGAAPAGAGTE